jgi:hypothetical protein
MSNGENNSVPEDLFRLRERLTREVAKPVGADYLKGEITRILRALGKKPGSPEEVAYRIAQELAPQLAHASNNLNFGSSLPRGSRIGWALRILQPLLNKSGSR